MGLALGVAAASGVRGQGLSQDSLADLLIAVAGQPFVQVRAGGLLRGHKLDGGAFRDDARGVRTQLDQRLHERTLLLVAAAGRVLAQPEGEAVHLCKADPVLDVVVLEQVHPGHDPEDSGAGRMSRSRFVLVNDELVLREQDAGGRLVRPAAEGVVHAVPEETLLVAVPDLPDHDPAAVISPHDLRDGDPFSDGVQQVRLDVLHAFDPVELILYELRDLLVPRLVAEGGDLEVQARDRVLPGLELAEQVGIVLLHLLKQLHLPHDVARVGLPEDLRQTDRGQAVGWVFAVFVLDPGDCQLPRLRPGERRGLRPAVASAHVTASSMRLCAVW